jgi:hypothetical protein
MPMGTGETSVTKYIAGTFEFPNYLALYRCDSDFVRACEPSTECQKVLEKSGLTYQVMFLITWIICHDTSLHGDWGSEEKTRS